MANDLSLSLRVPSMLMARLEELREHLEADPELAYLGEDLSKSMLVRLALQKGVEAMELLYGVAPAAGTGRITRATGSITRSTTRRVGSSTQTITNRTRRHRAPTEPLPEREANPEGYEEEVAGAAAAVEAKEGVGTRTE